MYEHSIILELLKARMAKRGGVKERVGCDKVGKVGNFM